MAEAMGSRSEHGVACGPRGLEGPHNPSTLGPATSPGLISDRSPDQFLHLSIRSVVVSISSILEILMERVETQLIIHVGARYFQP